MAALTGQKKSLSIIIKNKNFYISIITKKYISVKIVICFNYWIICFKSMLMEKVSLNLNIKEI